MGKDLVFEPLTRQTLSEQVMQRILEAIQNGAFRPGDRLPSEREMAGHFGVARNSVREALRALALVDVVVIRPGDGVYVAQGAGAVAAGTLSLTLEREKQTLADVLEARHAIEVDIAGLAAERATPEDIAQLEQAILEMEDQREGDPEGFVQGDMKFHRLLAAAARNTVLFRLAVTMIGLMEPASRKMSLRIPESRRRAIQGHKEIVAAIRARDGERARQAMVEHLKWAERLLAGEDG